jgi:formylglycine-generating enzyme required for sulfatase activity
MKRKLIEIILLLILIVFGCKAQERIEFEGELVKPPVSTMQLGPAIFFSESFVEKLGVTEGNPVRIIAGNKIKDLRVYKFFGSDTTFAMHRKYADELDLKEGKNKFEIVIISPQEATITPKPIRFSVENYKGNLAKWKGYAFGAPHGDRDFETGSVVKLVAENYGVPATAAYGCRLSYRGIWYDCNRPLMKEPREDGRGVIPERQWNEAAEKKYNIYQDSVWANSEMRYGERFELFTSFHGHDLTLKLPDGTIKERPVIEGMGVGFTKDELRKIKKFYYEHREEYWVNPPELYFGNLPEDRVYELDGVKLQFFYSGLGTRTYGSLRSDLCKRALHFETPDGVRLDEEVQPNTARFLADLYSFVRTEIIEKSVSEKEASLNVRKPSDLGKKILIPAGEFIMGAPEGKGWSSERPQLTVFVDEFYIDKYEVTNFQYVRYLNDALKENLITVKDGKVYGKNGEPFCDTRESNPFAEIIFKDGKFSVSDSREYFPVIFVTYFGAKAYAKFNGGDLPSEAEWEKAATWDGTKKYFYSVSRDTIYESDANFEDSGDPFEKVFPATTPVGFYETASPYGVKDMSGNVWEWCADTYKYGIYRDAKEKILKNPLIETEGTMKSVRGGAWNTEFTVTRGTMRLGINPRTGLVNLGFRCVYHKNSEER